METDYLIHELLILRIVRINNCNNSIARQSSVIF